MAMGKPRRDSLQKIEEGVGVSQSIGPLQSTVTSQVRFVMLPQQE